MSRFAFHTWKWSRRRVWTIFKKDLKDAIKDARVLVAIIVPFGIGIFYNATFHDETTQLTGTIVYSSADSTTLPAQIGRIAGEVVVLTFQQMPTEQMGPLLLDDKADLGLILPPGFDEAVERGEHPQLTVVQPATPTYAGNYAAAAIDPALRAMAGQTSPATVQVASLQKTEANESITDQIGVRTWAILGAIVVMIGMISMLAVPVILAEEAEKKTLDALVLIASYVEVIVAKALVGVVYVAVMVPLLLTITNISIIVPALFAAAVALLTVGLIGFGLLMAGFFKNANQLNTWSGILLLPVIAPAFAVGLPTPDWLQTLVGVLPSGAAAKMMINSAATDPIFHNNGLYTAILIGWAMLAYGLLYWRLSQRQA